MKEIPGYFRYWGKAEKDGASGGVSRPTHPRLCGELFFHTNIIGSSHRAMGT